MSWETSLQRPILTPKQLLVEGRTPEMFFREWVENTNLRQQIQVRDFGSISNLTGYLKVFVSYRAFREKVASVGVIRDAEVHSATTVFDSVCRSFTSAGLNAPSALSCASAGTPRTAVFVLPDCSQQGMLETLCWQVLQADKKFAGHLECVTAYLRLYPVQGTDP